MASISSVSQQACLLNPPRDLQLYIFHFVPHFYLIPLKASCRQLHSLVFTKISKKDSIDYCSKVAALGELKLLKWARANRAPWNALTCAFAAQSGHLKVLQWARSQGAPRNKDTCSFAAQGGHLAVLKWARAQEAPWNETTCAAAANEMACAFAAQGGHLEVLE